MSIETTNSPWAATAPGAGSASPPPRGAVAAGTSKSADDGGKPQGAASAGKPFEFWGADGFSFADLIDIVNPLQQLPIVGQIYRHMTGDTLDPGARLLGSTLYFGPLGLAGAGVDVAVEYETGEDIGSHVADLFGAGGDNTTATAAAKAPTTTAAAETGPETLAAAGTDGIQGADPEAGLDSPAEDAVMAWARRQTAWTAAQAPGQSTTTPTATPVAEVVPAALDATEEAAPTALDASRFLGADAPPPEVPRADVRNAPRPARSGDGALPSPAPAAMSAAAIRQATPMPTMAAGLDASQFLGGTPTNVRPPNSIGRVLQAAADDDPRPPAPAGAAAADGGWFTQTMLSALQKYRDTQQLVPPDDGSRHPADHATVNGDAAARADAAATGLAAGT